MIPAFEEAVATMKVCVFGCVFWMGGWMGVCVEGEGERGM